MYSTETEVKFRMSEKVTGALASAMTNAKVVDIDQYYLTTSNAEIRDMVFSKFNGLSMAKIAEIRIRNKTSQVILRKGAMNQEIVNSHECTMTLKSSGGMVREEHEVEISLSEFMFAKQFATGSVSKRRYTFNHSFLTFEYDLYVGTLFGLRTLECEFDPGQYTPDQITEKVLELDPNAVDKTENKAYKNANLSVCGGVQFLH